jgi:hypothetical protein
MLQQQQEEEEEEEEEEEQQAVRGPVDGNVASVTANLSNQIPE